MYTQYGAVHHLDVRHSGWIYRVFLLANTLQVDLAFVSEDEFGARAPTFQLVFGKTGKDSNNPPKPFEEIIGWSWLNALHVRSSLERGRLWQAEYFVSGMRNELISMYCRRYGLPEREGRGVDQLPAIEKERMAAMLVPSIDATELRRAFQAVAKGILDEVAKADPMIHSRLEQTLSKLAYLETDKAL